MNVFSEKITNVSGKWFFRIESSNFKNDIDPANLLPLEFFAARSLISDIVQTQDSAKLVKIFDYVITHLNDSRFQFDERWKKTSLKIKGPVKIQLVLKVYSFSNTDTEKLHSDFLKEISIGEKIYDL